ncbi:MAG: glycosyltransferase family 4 protein [bacterium]|nr:glycosyltransferase family 4 protein [bacterium]
MKILMLGWELPPHNSGGLGVACLQLCKTLSDSGADIDFILPYDKDHVVDFMKVLPAVPGGIATTEELYQAYDSTTVNTLYAAKYGSGSDQYHRYADGVEQIVSLGEYDVIHAHDWLTFRGAIRAKQLTGKPLIVHIHATEYDRAGGKSGNPIVTEIEYLGMQLADKIITVSQATKDIVVREYGINPNKVDVVHNSIDASFYEKLDDMNAYKYLSQLKSDGWRVIGNVGRLTVQKGLYNFLLAAREVVQRAPKTMFLIVGTGDQEEELIEHAAGLGISKNVLFIGFQRGKQWRDAFAICDLFVMPSVSEPFGLVPLEAIYYGTPVLITKQSGVAEVLNHCLKVDYWDIEAMADQMTAVVLHDSLRDTLHQGSLIDLQHSSWLKASDRIMNMYGELAGVAS